jgi:lipopolysaccharide/colanic/teichoic acid biosynthesis glycosyltransferase
MKTNTMAGLIDQIHLPDGVTACETAVGKDVGDSHCSDGSMSCAVEHRPAWYQIMERGVASAALIMALPLMLGIAVMIKLDSPGPALFRQKRLGRGARPFTFYKLRTMHVDGNKRFPHLAPEALRHEETSSLRLQLDDDPRVTRIGRWLRRTSLDEVPNFWHVLTGDMALVGPRPEMVEILPHYTKEQRAKFSVAPGITGYAQIYGRGDLSFLETVEYDLRYIRDRSTKTDLKILLKTVECVLTGKGAL